MECPFLCTGPCRGIWRHCGRRNGAILFLRQWDGYSRMPLAILPEWDMMNNDPGIGDRNGTASMGNTVSFTYTADGRIATVENAEGGVTRYSYDACGNLVRTEDALGHAAQYEYDAAGNRIKECCKLSRRMTKSKKSAKTRKNLQSQ